MRYSTIDFGNNFQNEIFGYYGYTLNNLERLQNLIIMIENVVLTGAPKKGLPGGEEAYMDANPEWLEFFITLPGYEQPYYVKTETLLKILKEYEVWLSDVESCQIPGLIPKSKLETWSCVPKGIHQRRMVGKAAILAPKQALIPNDIIEELLTQHNNISIDQIACD